MLYSASSAVAHRVLIHSSATITMGGCTLTNHHRLWPPRLLKQSLLSCESKRYGRSAHWYLSTALHMYLLAEHAEVSPRARLGGHCIIPHGPLLLLWLTGSVTLCIGWLGDE